ncbi:rab-GTPase-TBC domain-containing protein [Chytriomyces sp. MP71]|nr:rab-GTPase-TBC domain-containing protein [Chytriomyces sp. MP71]
MSKATLGVLHFWPHDRCASHILGRFQRLKNLPNAHLCQCLDASQAANSDYVYTVLEHFPLSLASLAAHDGLKVTNQTILKNIAFGLVSALETLASHDLKHLNLCPQNVLLDDANEVKLSNYHLYHITQGGELADVSIGYPGYVAPETIAAGIPDSFKLSHKADVWSVGAILVDLCLGPTYRFGQDPSLESALQIASFDWLDNLEFSLSEEETDLDLIRFILRCLTLNVSKRPSFYELLKDPMLMRGAKAPPRTASLDMLRDSTSARKTSPQKTSLEVDSVSAKVKVASRSSERLEVPNADAQSPQPEQQQNYLHKSEPHINAPSSLSGFRRNFGYQPPQLTLGEQYELYKIKAATTVEQILSKHGIGSIPSIERLPLFVSVTEEFDSLALDNGTSRQTACLFQDQSYTFTIHLIEGDIEVPVYTVGLAFTDPWTPLRRSRSKPRKPLALKEKNAMYQVSRVLKFKQILREFPLSNDELLKEAAIDIPPLMRGLIWACLLGVAPNITVEYDFIDKSTPTPADRQLELDIPRCHQYNELLASEEGHLKMARLLKSWVITETGKRVYWQGLDSLMAPFLALNFNDEARAYLCLKAFIDKYFEGFFLEDNSVALNKCMSTLKYILAFRDPYLAVHLQNLGIIPDMFAIPWVMTMFAQIFQLDRLYHLWDTILMGPQGFYVFIVYSIVHQIRDQLLAKDFSSCLVLFSELPPIDIETCIHLAVEAWRLTPPTLYKAHSVSPSGWIGTLDMQEFLMMANECVIVDCRSEESFMNHHISGSLHFDGSIIDDVRAKARSVEAPYVICIYASSASTRDAAEAHALLAAGVSHVCLVTSTLSGTAASKLGMCCCGASPRCTIELMKSVGLT